MRQKGAILLTEVLKLKINHVKLRTDNGIQRLNEFYGGVIIFDYFSSFAEQEC